MKCVMSLKADGGLGEARGVVGVRLSALWTQARAIWTNQITASVLWSRRALFSASSLSIDKMSLFNVSKPSVMSVYVRRMVSDTLDAPGSAVVETSGPCS